MPKPLDVKKLVAQHKEAKARSGGGNFAQLESGEKGNVLRLVPFTNAKDEEQLYVSYFYHFIAGKSRTCPGSIGEACPACEKAKALRAEGKKELAGTFSRRARFVYNVIQNGEYKVAEFPGTVHDAIMGYFEDENYGNIADLKRGRDIKVVKTGSGRDNTKYDVRVHPDRTAAPKASGEIRDLSTFVTPYSYEEMQDLLDVAIKADEFPPTEEAGGEDDGFGSAPPGDDELDAAMGTSNRGRGPAKTPARAPQGRAPRPTTSRR